MTDIFYLQDSRSNVGTGAMWWAKDGKGTTAHIMTSAQQAVIWQPYIEAAGLKVK